MNQKVQTYRSDLDLLKGSAIIAVVLYHMGISKGGYLGVDAFFVINGFLIVPKVIHSIGNNEFNFFTFLEKRISRFLPLALLASFLCLLFGYFNMLPDDYENLSESVIATNLFSNNILASITTNNYWAGVNEFKPLMHTWYIGILFEFYVLFPLIVLLIKWFSRVFHFGYYKYSVLSIIFLSIVSLFLFLHPSISAGDKFYLLQYRFFELAAGGLAGLWIVNHHKHLCHNGFASGVNFIVLLAVMFFGVFSVGNNAYELDIVNASSRIVDSYIPQTLLLLATVLLTVFFVLSDNEQSSLVRGLTKTRFLCILGMMSYSIYIWHQPMLAFYRYLVSSDFSLIFVLLFFVAVFSVSFLSYKCIEQRVHINLRFRVLVVIAFILVNGAAFLLYMHAGVVRDVPEMDIQKDKVHRNLHAEYVDRIFTYDTDFPIETKEKNILVIGNSFARDWCNILLESDVASKMNLSYIPKFGEEYVSRIKNADYVFVFDWRHNVPYYVWQNVKTETSVWGIGTKNFGVSNGIIYRNRHRDDYFLQSICIDPSYFEVNEQLKEEWGDHYIDLMKYVVDEKGNVRVFSDDMKFMSQDCRHLSRGGAKYYAQRLDFEVYFGKDE